MRTDNGMLELAAEAGIDEIERCDMLLVAGGFGTLPLERSEEVLRWIVKLDATTRFTTSVCTGALLLAAAGLLNGGRANTHWTVRERLREHGATPVGDRIVQDGKYFTSAGVSAGINLGIRGERRTYSCVPMTSVG